MLPCISTKLENIKVSITKAVLSVVDGKQNTATKVSKITKELAKFVDNHSKEIDASQKQSVTLLIYVNPILFLTIQLLKILQRKVLAVQTDLQNRRP